MGDGAVRRGDKGAGRRGKPRRTRPAVTRKSSAQRQLARLGACSPPDRPPPAGGCPCIPTSRPRCRDGEERRGKPPDTTFSLGVASPGRTSICWCPSSPPCSMLLQLISHLARTAIHGSDLPRRRSDSLPAMGAADIAVAPAGPTVNGTSEPVAQVLLPDGRTIELPMLKVRGWRARRCAAAPHPPTHRWGARAKRRRRPLHAPSLESPTPQRGRPLAAAPPRRAAVRAVAPPGLLCRGHVTHHRASLQRAGDPARPPDPKHALPRTPHHVPLYNISK